MELSFTVFIKNVLYQQQILILINSVELSFTVCIKKCIIPTTNIYINEFCGTIVSYCIHKKCNILEKGIVANSHSSVVEIHFRYIFVN